MDSETLTITKPAPPSIVAELAPILSTAKGYAVLDTETHRVALERAAQLRRGEKMIEDHFADARKAAHSAHQKIVQAVNGLLGPIAAARRSYEISAVRYERAELERAAERQRLEQAEARRREEERQLAEAVEAEAAGDVVGAEAILDAPLQVPVVQSEPQVAKVSGVSPQKRWGAKVNDVEATLRFMLERPEWSETLRRCIPVLETALRPLAVAQRRALSIPGVEAVESDVRSYR